VLPDFLYIRSVLLFTQLFFFLSSSSTVVILGPLTFVWAFLPKATPPLELSRSSQAVTRFPPPPDKMHSFVRVVLAVGSLLSTSVAQTFNASAVSSDTRDAWCNDQVAQCPRLCSDLDKSTVTNECFPDNLVYTCLCSDNVTPNLTQYSQTIPYYECTVEQTDCVAACGLSDNDCSNECRKKFVCGATDPKKGNKTLSASQSATSTSSGATNTGGDTGTGFARADGSSDSSSGARALMLEVGHAYGLGLVAAGIAVGAAMIGL